MFENKLLPEEKLEIVSNQENQKKWLDRDSEGCSFKDQRLRKRFRKLLEQIWSGLGKAIPFACQDWANTKAAYRFLSNDNVSEKEILEGHFEATKERVSSHREGMILVLQDTTEFSYKSSNPEKIGFTTNVPTGKTNMMGKPELRKQCGILMHSSLAITDKGLPLGLCAIKFWTRKQFKGTNELKKRINPTQTPIEQKESYRWLQNLKQSTELLKCPKRCIHIGDRESDIYELFVMAKECSTHFLFRICHNRIVGKDESKDESTITDVMNGSSVQGLHNVVIKGPDGNMIEVKLEIKYQNIKILPPVGIKRKQYPPLDLTVIHAVEKDNPKDRDKVAWKLMTNLPVTSSSEAIEKLDWYALRWRIETFHKILKSGCKAESLKLRTAERLCNLIAIFCVVSWRIFWMTMITRASPNAPPELALTSEEIDMINALDTHKDKNLNKNTNLPLSYYLLKIARLGGYLNRKSDPPPGNIVIWRGLSRLTDLKLGFNIAMNMTCG